MLLKLTDAVAAATTAFVKKHDTSAKAYPYLFKKIYRGLQIHTEINKIPRNPLVFVLFLLKYEHKVIEILLKLFIRHVDAELFEAIELVDVRLNFFVNAADTKFKFSAKTHRAHT